MRHFVCMHVCVIVRLTVNAVSLHYLLLMSDYIAWDSNSNFLHLQRMNKCTWFLIGSSVPDLWSKWRGFKSPPEWWKNFLLQGQLSVQTLILVSIPPPVTAVARKNKRSQSFCQKCRWLVTAKSTCTLHMWLWMKWHCKLVHGCMVYPEPVLWQQHFHVAAAMKKISDADFFICFCILPHDL